METSVIMDTAREVDEGQSDESEGWGGGGSKLMTALFRPCQCREGPASHSFPANQCNKLVFSSCIQLILRVRLLELGKDEASPLNLLSAGTAVLFS